MRPFGIGFLEQFRRHIVKDKAIAGVGLVGFLGIGIEIDRQRVFHPADIDFLVEALVGVLGIIGGKPHPALAALDLEQGGRVIGRLGVGNVLYVADDAFENLGRIIGCPIAYRLDLDAGFVLAGVVNDVEIVLPDLIDGQAGA